MYLVKRIKLRGNINLRSRFARCISLLLLYISFVGDLKTFLLARRHLVGEETKEAEDIMPEALTRMALDVCYGLKYLTDLKYVHRYLYHLPLIVPYACEEKLCQTTVSYQW